MTPDLSDLLAAIRRELEANPDVPLARGADDRATERNHDE